MHVLAGVRPVSTDARVGEQMGLPEYARWNQTVPGARDIASRWGVPPPGTLAAGDPVRDQSPQPRSSLWGNGLGEP